MVFVGWYSDSELTKEFDFDSQISDDVTLYAKWREYEKGKVLASKTQNSNTINAKIIADDDIASKIELTDDEINHMESGRNVLLYLEVADISDSILSESKEMIEKELNSIDKIGMYLDVNLFKKVEGESAVKVTKTKNPIKISFEIPEELLTIDSNITRIFKVLRLHDGNVTELEVKVDGNIGTFETDEFSTYALMYSDTINNTNAETTNNPQTGDNILFYVSMLSLSVLELTGAGLYIKKDLISI